MSEDEQKLRSSAAIETSREVPVAGGKAVTVHSIRMGDLFRLSAAFEKTRFPAFERPLDVGDFLTTEQTAAINAAPTTVERLELRRAALQMLSAEDRHKISDSLALFLRTMLQWVMESRELAVTLGSALSDLSEKDVEALRPSDYFKVVQEAISLVDLAELVEAGSAFFTQVSALMALAGKARPAAGA